MRVAGQCIKSCRWKLQVMKLNIRIGRKCVLKEEISFWFSREIRTKISTDQTGSSYQESCINPNNHSLQPWWSENYVRRHEILNLEVQWATRVQNPILHRGLRKPEKWKLDNDQATVFSSCEEYILEQTLDSNWQILEQTAVDHFVEKFKFNFT